MIDYGKLMREAERARGYSYAPYSHFSVGAALLTESGKIYLGCNIENAAYSPTNCAERTAIFKAVSEGERKFLAIAVIGGKQGAPGGYCAPCGVCRQVMAEFCGKSFQVILGTADKYTATPLSDLIPEAFTKEDLQ